ncbi:hypothetical protein BCR37DRAFT_388917 [Protomyces lactucae-debilis]|uniref:Uncharacterized protein n=1 Tax=Protomyces lactucae-debilis TaxID=2754530 RepID=A0A1Y2F2R7_PROLT|nr:uncharacterized protein BCR37DRAFT_388917 [Protomyces lactucae-debilis]ORY78188.1 hypothetical protein BCR37DRAFT_388917 [Protomyces lactucae-debilis]
MTVHQGEFKYPYLQGKHAPEGFRRLCLKKLSKNRGIVQRTSPTDIEVVVECRDAEAVAVVAMLTDLLAEGRGDSGVGDRIDKFPSRICMEQMAPLQFLRLGSIGQREDSARSSSSISTSSDVIAPSRVSTAGSAKHAVSLTLRDTVHQTAAHLDQYVSLGALTDWAEYAVGKAQHIHCVYLKSELFQGGLGTTEVIRFQTTTYKITSQEIAMLALTSVFVKEKKDVFDLMRRGELRKYRLLPFPQEPHIRGLQVCPPR